MMTWLMHHRRAILATLAQMALSPVASLFTLFAIGVALSLPAGMYVLLDNATQIAGTLPAQNEMTVFMRDDASPDDVAKLKQQIKAMPDLADSRFVPRQTALQQISAQMGMSELAAELPKNPLPDAWIVTPASTDANTVARLIKQLEQLPAVALVQADHKWAQRLDALLALGRELINILAIILGIALIAITGNTIRLQIITRHAEIEVSRLIGATDRFIRRPFLYFGAIQGLVGGVIAWGIVTLGIALLSPQIDTLNRLYATQIQLHALGLADSLILFAFASLLGWLGAYISVGRTLSRIENTH
jgi:cell division transport system permease protein